jgi:hypothetical protein
VYDAPKSEFSVTEHEMYPEDAMFCFAGFRLAASLSGDTQSVSRLTYYQSVIG